jgi:hypothetical protein
LSDEQVFREWLSVDCSDRGSVSHHAGTGINITDDFLRKYKFDERRTEEMEQKTFNVAK